MRRRLVSAWKRQARWTHIQANAKQASIGQTIDRAMEAIERENESLRGVLPRDYGREALDKRRLGEIVDLISTIGLGSEEQRSQDVLGRVYECFLGQFYTARSVVQLLVAMLASYKGRMYDPCCGSGGMFVQNEKFISSRGAHCGKRQAGSRSAAAGAAWGT